MISIIFYQVKLVLFQELRELIYIIININYLR